jgi:hypothetical protein
MPAFVPEAAFSAYRDAADIFPSTLYQPVVTDFIRQGHFARHIRRMKMLYMERRNCLVQALNADLGRRLQVVGSEAGMHLVALLPGDVDDSPIASKAAERGISAMPLSSCYLYRAKRRGLILGYGGTNEPQDQAGNVCAQGDNGKVIAVHPAHVEWRFCEVGRTYDLWGNSQLPKQETKLVQGISNALRDRTSGGVSGR